MRTRALVMAIIMAALIASVSLGAAADYEVFRGQPDIHVGMNVGFRRLIAQASTDYVWQVTVQTVRPQYIEFSWTGSSMDRPMPPPKVRRVVGMARSRTFGPNFGNRDYEETDTTAPWLSREVFRELRDNKTAYNYWIGSFSLAGVVAMDLKVGEEMLYPVELNGRRVYLPAIKTSNGQFTVWNNLNNPLVLEFKPFGIPLVTGMVGWRVETMSVRSR